MQISENGGDPELLAEIESEDFYAPQMLPDGKTVMFTMGPTPYRIMLKSLESGETKELIAPGDTAQYIPTGHIVYGVVNGGGLYAIPFDLEKLETTGGCVPVMAGVLRAGGAPHYSVSNSGTLVYIPGPTEGGGAQFDPVWVDRDGKEGPSLAPPNAYWSPKISPDGMKVALEAAIGGNSDIWIWDIERGTRERLTNDEGMDAFPLWTPDGKRVIFASNREGSYNIYWKAADGTGETEPLLIRSNLAFMPTSISPDGNTLVLMTGTEDIGTISMEGDSEWTPLLQAEYDEMRPRISPDGRWMAYMSDETGQFEIYIRPFPDVNSDKYPVSTSGGTDPIWSPDGHELFYRNNDKFVMVSVETEPALSLEKPKVLFQGDFVSFSNNRDTFWDIHPDGDRFLMIKPFRTEDESTSGTPRQINVVLNWFEELKERVPTDQ
jgi:serine/threonine-protein kinase